MELLSSRESLDDIAASGVSEPYVVCPPMTRSGETSAFVSMPALSHIGRNALTREERIREAVLLSFCEPLPAHSLQLESVSEKEWKALIKWLDISGLALYFLDRMTELQLDSMLPPSVLARLQQNLRDNTERTRGMIAESVAIQQELQQARLSYATLKGFSLGPYSVPKPELRHQLDLDFLIAEKSAPEARRILEKRGYRLQAISGRSWEFKMNERACISLKNLYKNSPSRSVELHIENCIPGRRSLLGCIEKCEFYGIQMPVLSPVDLFLGQGLHAYKHVNSEFSRAAHLLEFRRHVLARYNDDTFWHALELAARENPSAFLGLGVVTLLITNLMGEFAPQEFMSWTVHRLPRSARLWVKLYGRRIVFKNFPGSKLYLLLQRELESTGIPARRSLRQALLPSRLPPEVIHASADETLSERLRRYRVQLHFILFRLRFHIVEGLRYARESYRWRKHMNRYSR